MRLLEYQSRRLLASFALPFGELVVVSSSAAAAREAERMGGPVVMKAQVPFGGRGKAGLVQVALMAAGRSCPRDSDLIEAAMTPVPDADCRRAAISCSGGATSGS